MQTNSVHVSNLGDIKLVENEETKTAGDDNDYEKEVTDNEIYEKKEDKSSWKGAVIEDKSLWFKFKFGKGENAPETRFNPVVTSVSIILITGFITWCILEEDAKTIFSQARLTVTRQFSWFYTSALDFWGFFIVAIYFSKYGSMKLGADDDKPEYPDGSWFCMLFACGLGVGLFFYGVAEPILHYNTQNRYTADRFMPDNEAAQNAMTLTIYHWGFHAWTVYALVGMSLAFISFRKGLPMTMKSCFYPLIGDRIFGWMGNAIDILSVITTVFGICTSLGIGTIQLNSGLRVIFPSLEKTITVQVVIIWVVMCVATVSVVSGVGVGIRRLSEVCFGVGIFLLAMIFILDDSWFILNLFIQSIGHYIQNFIYLGFRTDAFEQMNITSRQGAQRGRLFDDGASDGPASWMNDWTIFFWGWWVSWAPFVGMFIAKISKGRTIRQLIHGTMTAPVIYICLWLTVFGGSALRNDRLAANLHSDKRPYCCAADYDILDWEAATAATDGDWSDELVSGVSTVNAGYGFELEKSCTKLAVTLWEKEWKANDTVFNIKNFESFYKNMDKSKMAVSDDSSVVRLSCLKVEDMWFALMGTKGKVGTMLSVISIFAILLYFVTSADSGSLVLDVMASNGDQNTPRLQKVFWAVVEGATASALLIAGGSDALSAVQTASVISGLPYAVMVSFLCISLWRGLAMEFGDLDPYGLDFRIGIIDPFTVWDPKLWLEFLKNIFVAPVVIYKTCKRLGGGAVESILLLLTGYTLWCLWVVLHIAEIEVAGLFAVGWVAYLGFILLLTIARYGVRSHFGINGNPVEDFFATLVLYPSVAIQLDHAFDKQGLTTLVPRSSDVDVVFENENANGTV